MKYNIFKFGKQAKKAIFSLAIHIYVLNYKQRQKDDKVKCWDNGYGHRAMTGKGLTGHAARENTGGPENEWSFQYKYVTDITWGVLILKLIM